jgi:putative acetyltransferase
MNNDYNDVIHPVTPADYLEIMEVWESSVKATHKFLSDEDFNFYKNILPSFFPQVKMHCVKDSCNHILGFLGTQEDTLEMLFVRDGYRGMGLGKRLLKYAIHKLNVYKVDVNQQNDYARVFYYQQGFRMKRFSRIDGFGKPYPIWHMEFDISEKLP